MIIIININNFPLLLYITITTIMMVIMVVLITITTTVRIVTSHDDLRPPLLCLGARLMESGSQKRLALEAIEGRLSMFVNEWLGPHATPTATHEALIEVRGDGCHHRRQHHSILLLITILSIITTSSSSSSPLVSGAGSAAKRGGPPPGAHRHRAPHG
jgi:hypothetical protein